MNATAAQVSMLFDAKAAGWSAKYAPGGPLAGRLVQLSDAVRRQTAAGAALLDVGCGTGELARYLAARGLRVTGCDISAVMLGAAIDRDPGRTVRWTDLEPGWQVLPFGTASFEVVVAASVVEYSPDPVAMLREFGRVLLPGGVLHCTVPDLRHPIRWMELPARMTALALPFRPPTSPASRLASYLAYLRLSQQRHALTWWRAAAIEAGLHWQGANGSARQRQPLRLVTLRKHPSGQER